MLEEFTLNASLVINNEPQIALVNAPDKNRLFYTYSKDHSYELKNNKEIILNCEKKTKKNQIIAVSYSNELNPIIKEFHE